MKNTMLLYTQNVLKDFMNGDRFTEWFVKKIILLGAALHNLFADILTISLCCLLKKFLIKSMNFLKFLNSTFANYPVSPFCQIYFN